MAGFKSKTARQIALGVLNKFNVDAGDAPQILGSIIDQTAQRAQATDLVFGVIRNRLAIDMVVSTIAEVPVERIQKKLLNILRIGGYELIFAPKTAEYAIVNEAVELSLLVAGKKQSGFVNAVLRNITRNITSRTSDLTDADIQRMLPQSPQFGCKFKAAILPDPQRDPAGYLSKAFSLPKWLVTNWLSEFDFDKTRKICFASNRRPGVFLQPNLLKTTVDGLVEKLIADDVKADEFEVIWQREMIKLKSNKLVSELSSFAEGLFTIQDPTAVLAALSLGPKPGWTIIDLCAAPGTKTVQMAWLMNNNGRIIATDINSDRLQKVDQNCRRLGITIVQTVGHDLLEEVVSKLPSCDAILLDVPCSNTGVLARRPEVRLRIKPQVLISLAETQLGLLEKA